MYSFQTISTNCALKTGSLKMAPSHCWNSRQHICSKDSGEVEEPLIANIQVEDQQVACPFDGLLQQRVTRVSLPGFQS